MANVSLPYTNLAYCLFSPIQNVVSASMGRGLTVNVFEISEQLFKVDIQTVAMIPHAAPHAAWRAFRAQLRGGLNTFSTWDVNKRTPLAYPNATSAASISGAWSGTAVVTSLGASGALGLSGLPANYAFSAGDYIGLEEGGRYDLYEVATSVTANGSGVVTVSVLPYLRTTVFTTSAVARIWRPVAAFILDPASWQEDGSYNLCRISFSGTQRI
jgi:hypothetical protein